MQFQHNIIQILNAHGEVIGSMKLPASIKLHDLAPLKMLGAISVKVVPDHSPFTGVSLEVSQ